MPALVRLYIRNVIYGFLLSVIFVSALLWFNVANLWHLISTSPDGWVAVAMLFVFNGIVFSGAQFAIAVMQMAEDPGGGGTGRNVPIATDKPVLARVATSARRRPR